MQQSEKKPVILMNEAALAMPAAEFLMQEGVQIIVAGRGVVQMTLAELTLPEAQLVWTDFRQSASLRRLHGQIQALGGLDRMALAVDGSDAEAMFSVMCAILTFLPALRRNGGGRIELIVSRGDAVASLQSFLDGLTPRLGEVGIEVALSLRDPDLSRAA